MAMLVIVGIKGIADVWISEVRRRRPYLPSLRRILARIMDPATGASTWALGSQRWRE